MAENSRGRLSGEQNVVIYEELTGVDYVKQPIVSLFEHPDFNVEAMSAVGAILQMTSSQLEELNKIINNQGDIHHGR